jgi:hypothetical protein
MNSVKLLGQRLSASDFDRQVAEFQVRGAIPNGLIALGTPITVVAREVCPRKGERRSAIELCKRANRDRQVLESKAKESAI